MATTQPKVGELLTESQVADKFAMSIAALRKWRCEKKGPPYLALGRCIRYDADALDRWLTEQVVNPQ